MTDPRERPVQPPTEPQAMTCETVRDLAPLYVLGALERDEEAAVRAHVAACPDAHAELAELGGVVPYLLEDVELVEPPAALRDRILAAAADDRPMDREADAPAAGIVPSAPGAPAAPARPAAPIAFPDATERASRARRARGPIDWGLRIAAVLAIVALGAWNLILQRDLAADREFQAAVAQVMTVAAQPDAAVAVLRSEAGGASGLAAVDSDGRVVFALRNLPATSGEQVYTAWSIAGTDPPAPIGEFRVGESGTGVLETIANVAGPGATLALTLEPAPGARVPTLPTIVVGVATPA